MVRTKNVGAGCAHRFFDDSEEEARARKRSTSRAAEIEEEEEEESEEEDEGDEEEEGEEEEEEAFEGFSLEARKKKKKEVQRVSTPFGMRMVRSLPTKDSRHVAVNYKTMPSNEYVQLRQSLVFHGRAQRTAFDRWFWKIEHQDIYESICLHPWSNMCSPHKYMDVQFIVNNEMKLGQGVGEIIDAKGLRDIMQFHQDWNEEAILQFYATCFFATDKARTVHWMTGGERLSCTFVKFAQLLGLDGTQGYSIHSHAAKGLGMPPKALAPLYPPGHAHKAIGISTAMIPKYAFLFKCLTLTLVPKSGDYISVRNFAIDLMLEMTILDRKLNVADFIFHEMCLASYSQGRSLPYGPFIQAMIDAFFQPSIQMDCPHKGWCPRFDTKKKAPMPEVAPLSRPVVPPLTRFEKFMAKAQRSIFHMCKFNAQEVVTNNKLVYARTKMYKDHLHALGDTQVSDDEAPPTPAVPVLPEFTFPEASYEDYFVESPAPSDAEDDDASDE
ncbi:hypothetical protein ACQ4PT_008148 [Festuca glaucescens]